MNGQGTAANPLIEKFGPGPLSIFAVIRMPDGATWRRYPEVAGEMVKAALELARDYRVETGRCGCCGRETSEIIVGESARSLTETGRRWAVCRPCVMAHGGASLRRKLAYIDHTRNAGR